MIDASRLAAELAQDDARGPIPFNRPALTGLEGTYMSDALARGHVSGDGHYSKAVHELLERELGVNSALLTTSCTHALEMTALLAECGPGDEVILPSFTFVSTANAFVLRGAKPIFADIRPDTLNLDERLLPDLVTSRTKAVVVVHYAGVGCAMDEIAAIVRERGITVIEDNAHGLFGRYRGRLLGTLGDLATLSFHETKNFTCGEGGALLVNNERYKERAEIIREKGTNRARFFRGQVDKYSWVDVGSSYLPSDLLAAYLLAQLEHREAIQLKRRALWDRYREALGAWSDRYGVGLPFIPAECEQAYHMFYLLMPSLEERQRFIAAMREQQILTVFHYVPLHRSEMGRRLGGDDSRCPVTEDVSDRLVRLPFYNQLSETAQQRVIEAILNFRPKSS